MAQVGKIDDFRPEVEPWTAYIERLEQNLEANDVDEEKHVAVLLSVMGAKAYGLLRNLVQPEKPKDKTFGEIVDILKEHYEPKPILVAERFRFNRCNQKTSQTVAHYVAELKQQAANCDFGASLDSALRDRFVSGIKNEACQRRLLSEDRLTFAKAFEIALTMETADRDTRQLRGAEGEWTSEANIHKVRPVKTNMCYRCKGKNHNAHECHFKETKCHNCGKIGHIRKACRTKVQKSHEKNVPSRGSRETKYVTAEEDPEEELAILTVNAEDDERYKATFAIDNVDLEMEIDTGAAKSVISHSTYLKKFSHLPLQPAKVKLKAYNGGRICVLGQLVAKVMYEDQAADLPLLIVKGHGASLCGRNWLTKLRLNWQQIKYVGEPKQLSLNELLDTYSDVFKEELGTLKDIKATIVVKPEMLPKFNKHRPLPFTMKEKVEKELERLEKCDIITPVRHSEWAAPIVPVLKRDASIRLCGDYKVSVNQALEADAYPLPRLEELLATLRGRKYFSKIDLAAAYQQVLLNEDSKKYTTINTHKGLFVYNRLPFGISTAPSIFQRIMENIMEGLPVVVYLDDLLITGCSKAEHLSNLEKVLQRLQENGLRVKRSKCEFNKPQIEYLGHILDEHGVHPSEEKVRAIQDAPAPTNVKELQVFLGLVNYYGRFVPMQSMALAPLYMLLKDSVTWRWTDPEQAAFDRCKGLLTSDRLLAHYDSNLPLTLACDASAYGIGAVIQHTMPSGEERPIAYASRTLSPAEKKYSQIEKEALGLIYGVKKFHQYLWGRHFTLATDHRPLLTLFGEHKNLPTLAAACIQRWAIILLAYDYHIVFKKSAEHSNADGLSRCPLPETSDTGTALSSAAVHSLLIAHMEEAPLNATQVARATRRDMDLSKVYQYVTESWPTVTDESLKAYHNKRNELSTERGCVLWGTRVIIPSKMRMAVLNEIHSGHQGIVKSKALARKYVWWPNLDYDLEQVCKTCETCQLEQKMPQHVPLHPWEFPGESWKRLHIDFAGPFLESMFMIVVDSYSKWLEVFRMPHITSQATITRLKRLFASYGLPEQIVTDNATTFTSAEFQTFVQNGILHTSAPGHPPTNGLAERYVQTFKVGMKKLASKSGSIEDKLSLFLLQYHVTPNYTTGQSPAELFLHRHIRTRLDFIKPNIKETVRRKQYRQKAQHDFTAVDRSFSVDDAVYLRNTGGGVHKWTPGQVVRQTGPVSYEVKERYSNTVHR
ncbi:uncharacterized protein K02A2.6-like [Xiphophorus couchianus]|uniref:uncharacterized protein K02A2.6-like n=1 Tax=Xiphophorus couchianus TaxID=32473 RepID=UPI001015DCE0|nr:uncharacterized protein K02A2.6-like [Xiphophorus couchianus]